VPRKAHFSDHDFVVVKHVQVNSAAQALQFNRAFDASAAKLVIADLPAKVVALLQPFLDSKNTSDIDFDADTDATR